MIVDYLIIGQGLAGSVLGYLLAEDGNKICIFNIGHPNVASQVAAGLMNPITGKRLVKAKEVDQALPFAHEFYLSLEKKLGISFFESIPIIRLLKEGERAAIEGRLKNPEYEKYLSGMQEGSSMGPYLKDEYGSVCIGGGAIVHLRPFLEGLKKYFLEKGILQEEVFDYQKLKMGKEVEYGSIKAKACIFCEGAGVRANPWFGKLPFEYTKGEVLTIQLTKGFLEKKVFIKDYALIPVGSGVYRLGATYDWDHIDYEFTKNGERELIKGLQEIVKVDDFEIVQRDVGIRVNGRNRLPMIERHARYSDLIVFNGFGSKGILTIPFEAHRLMEQLGSGKKMCKKSL